MNLALNGNGGLFDTLSKLFKRLPLAIWLALGGQLAGGAYWLIRLDQRVTENEAIRTRLQARIEEIDQKDTRAGNIVAQRVTDIERNLQDFKSARTEVSLNNERIRQLSDDVKRVEERMNRIVQVLDNMYERMSEHIRRHPPPSPQQ